MEKGPPRRTSIGQASPILLVTVQTLFACYHCCSAHLVKGRHAFADLEIDTKTKKSKSLAWKKTEAIHDHVVVSTNGRKNVAHGEE